MQKKEKRKTSVEYEKNQRKQQCAYTSGRLSIFQFLILTLYQ